MSLLVKNIGCIVGIDESGRTRVAGKEMAGIGTLENAWLLTDGERIGGYGTMDTLPSAERRSAAPQGPARRRSLSRTPARRLPDTTC